MVTRRAFNLSPIALILTSQKSKVVTTADKVSGNESQTKSTSSTEKLEEKDENWISYGYSLVDRDEDEWAHHLLMFCTITIMFCWGTFLIAYYPDFKNQAWAQREAYLELERRQSAGLPLIDPNMIPVDQIDLPTDEELADFEIII
jgi:NADH dehydrogenase (ubiquinone) 1 beta subcomplex subunit 11